MEICVDGNSFGAGLVMALRPPALKRLNGSLRRGGSERVPRRPASLLAVPKCEENGSTKGELSGGAATWAQSFEKLMDDPMGLQTFAEFLKKEFSAENIYFWTACERYRCLPAGPERIAEALRIHKQHLAEGAIEAVNVDSHGRQCTEQILQEASETLWDQTQKQIFNLMKFDSYPRFLQSELYEKCLKGASPKPQLDARLLLRPGLPVNKLKKSFSNAEKQPRSTGLPWTKKNRSKSKDRGETEYSQKNGIGASQEGVRWKGDNSDIHSSKSSLTSQDLAIFSAQDPLRGSQDDMSSSSNGRNVCRIILTNSGSTTVVPIKSSETVKQLVNRLLDKRGLTYSYEVYINKHPKAVDINEPSAILAGCEVSVAQRVAFKLDLISKKETKQLNVKTKPTNKIVDVLRAVMADYHHSLDGARITCNNELIDLHVSIDSIDGKRLRIQYYEDVPVQNLDKLTNQVFDDIRQEKSGDGFRKPKSDKGSVKSEDWGSEHSSSFMGRFLRRDSGFDRKKKPLISWNKGHNTDDASNEETPKPLIAKLKPGANKLQVACSESDDWVEGLSKMQRRIEDQRGTEINCEIPDFLKYKDRKPSANSPHSRFYVDNNAALAKNLSCAQYENRIISPKDLNSCTNKQKDVRAYPSSEDSSMSTESSPRKCGSLEKTIQRQRSVEPPPLPPKPKIVPIKPQNWGNNGFYKSKPLTTNDKKTLFLEQASSSIV